MKQTLRKILAVLVVFSIVLSVGIVALNGSAAGTMYFEDDFNTGTLADHVASHGWSNATSGELVNGAFAVNAGNYTNWVPTAAMKNLTDYVFEADVKADVTTATGTAGTLVFAIIGRTTTIGTDGYEFGICFSRATPDKPYLRMYRRSASGNTYVGGSGKQPYLSDVLGRAVTLDETFHLKMVMNGSNIKGYVNDVLVYDETDTALTKGTIGVKGSSVGGVIDNVKVYSIGYGEDASSEVSSNTSSATEELDIYFQEDFETTEKFATAGWQRYTQSAMRDVALDEARRVQGAQGYEYALGKLNQVRAYSLSGNSLFTGANAIYDYTIEADVWYDASTDPGATNVSFVGLVGRSVNENGVEFAILHDKRNGSNYARIYNRAGSTNDEKVIANNLLSGQFVSGQIYTLKLVCIGSTVRGYINGVKVAEGTITANRVTAGVPAMTSSGYDSYIDNFVVREPSANEKAGLDDNASSAPSDTSSDASSEATSSGAQTPDGYYFFEDFNDDTFETGWSTMPTADKVTDGKYLIATSRLSDHNVVKNLTDYVVEAKVTVDGASNKNGARTSVAGITGREASGKRYEFCLLYNFNTLDDTTPAVTYVRLYLRGDNEEVGSTALKQQLQLNKEYTLKMVFIGNTLKCYVDGVMVYELETALSAGTAGLYRNGLSAYVDDYTVRAVTQQEKDDTLNSGSTSSGSTSSGSTSSGNTSSGNTSSSTPTVLPEGYYFFEDFNDSTFETGWNSAPNAANLKDGTLKIAGRYLSNHATVKNLTDYVVEAKVKVDTTSSRKGASTAAAGITGRVQSGKGYELGLTYEYTTTSNDGTLKGTYVRLIYRKSSGVDWISTGMAKDKLVEGKEYTLKMAFIGNMIKCYLDGELVGEFEDTSSAFGAAGMCVNGYDAYIDDFAVRVPTAQEIADTLQKPAKPVPEGYYYFEDFNDPEDLGQGWNSELDKTAIKDGAYKISPRQLSNHSVIKNLTDYVVEAKVMVDGTSSKKGAQTAMGGIVGRFSGNGGYEYTLVYEFNSTDDSDRTLSRSYLRLYLRGTDGGIINANMQMNMLELNQTYTLKMVFLGDRVKCYLDGEEVGQFLADKRASGSAGMCFNGLDAYIDDFAVRQPTEAEKAVYVPTKPEADENGVYYSNNFSGRSAIQDVMLNWAAPFGGYQNGQAILSHSLALNTNFIKNEDFSLMTDYVIDAVFTFSADEEALNAGPVFAVTGRLNAAGNGYELGVMGNTAGTAHNLRLYDRISERSIVDEKIDVQRGKAYRLRMVMNGDKILAYLDDDLIFTVTDVDNLKGTAGMMINGITTYVDSYTLRKATAAELKGEGGKVVGGGSVSPTPNTGDSVRYLILALSLVLVAAATLYVFKPKFIRQ